MKFGGYAARRAIQYITLCSLLTAYIEADAIFATIMDAVM